jgi:hypothetical protein
MREYGRINRMVSTLLKIAAGFIAGAILVKESKQASSSYDRIRKGILADTRKAQEEMARNTG